LLTWIRFMSSVTAANSLRSHCAENTALKHSRYAADAAVIPAKIMVIL
jgi:hypothetical protein